MAKVPFVDLGRIHRPLEAQLQAAFAGALAANAFVGGAAVERFEAEWAAYVGAPFCVAVSSGTAALELALRAVAGSGRLRDEVLTVPNSFFATAEAVLGAWFHVRFADVDPASQLLDPAALASALTGSTRMVVPVHLFGQPCDMEPIWELAEKRSLAVIEDACQAHGAVYGAHRIGGSARSHAVCWSYYPGKNLGALGDAGAVTTHDAQVADCIRRLRDHGSAEKYKHNLVGTNARMDALQAAWLSLKLPHLDEWNESRRRAAERYRRRLSAVPGVGLLPVRACTDPCWHLFVVEVDDRDGLQQHLAARGIGTGIHYPVPIHLQDAMQPFFRRGDFPVAERLAGRILSLPMFAGIRPEEVDAVCDAVEEFTNRPDSAKATSGRQDAKP